MNKWIGTGRLTKDPELHMTANNKQVVNFSIAVDRKYKQEGQPTADFFNCIAFGKTAEFICKWFTKGKMIVLDGSLQTRSWEDKENKKKHSVVEIIIENVEFAGDKSDGNSNPNTSEPKRETKASVNAKYEEVDTDDSDDSLPF